MEMMEEMRNIEQKMQVEHQEEQIAFQRELDLRQKQF
jgi:hypothetical protein